MDFLIGLGLLVWATVVFVWGQFFSDGLTSQDIIQIAVSGIGGLVVLGPVLINAIMNTGLPKPKPKPDTRKKIDKHKKRLNAAQEKQFQDDYYDFIALNYLKDRANSIKSKEAFELVIKLNTIIFSLTKDISNNAKK